MSSLVPALTILLFGVAASLDAAAQGVAPNRVSCPAGCGERGHCNYEEGRCECPWGYTGPTCEVDRMAVCRQTPDDPGSCGLIFPKNCECYRECFRLYCHYGTDTDKCTHQWGSHIRQSACWLYGNPATGELQPLQNSSWYPEHPENETVWYDQIPEFFDARNYTEAMLLKDDERRYVSPYHHPWVVWHRAENRAHPLKNCTNQCSNGRGYCIQYPWRNKPMCSCHMGYNGTDCSQDDVEEACWFSPDCGGRGRCRSGFCHCRDGHWGMGCHRTTAFQPEAPGTVPDLRPRTGLKIYMYELPWEIAFPYEVGEEAHTRDPMYTAYELFLKYFLRDGVVRTENPYEANLFYVPALVYFYAENVRNPQWQSETVISYIRQRWPFYNRTGGRDHFMFMAGDRGGCDTERWLQDSIIKIVHFGMQQRNLTWPGIKNEDYACIQVKRDLVVPPRPHADRALWPTHTQEHYEWLVSNGGHDGNRTLLFFFAGGVGDGTEYSGGHDRPLRGSWPTCPSPSRTTSSSTRAGWVTCTPRCSGPPSSASHRTGSAGASG